MANIYNKAGLVAIPAPYKDGFLYNIRPDDDTLAFKFDRGSSATFVNKEGFVDTSVSTQNTPRIDYTDSLTSPALLLEPSSTNKVTQSETFSTWNNFYNGVDLTNVNITAPNGYSTVIKMTRSNVTLPPNVTERKITFNTDTTNATDSIFAKMGEVRYIFNRRQSNGVWGSVVFDLQNGVIAVNNYTTGAYPKITDYGNGWYRCEVYYTGVNHVQTGWGLSDGTDHTYSSTSTTDGLYIWGAQQENNSFATSYIPTTNTTATRLAETCINAGSASTFNSTEGVLYAEIAALTNISTATKRVITLKNTDSSKRVSIIYNPDSTLAFYFSESPSVFYQTSAYDITQNLKIAFKYKQNDFAAWVNGVEIFTDTSNNTFTAGTFNGLDFNETTINPFYGRTKGVYVFNEALSDDELQQLTGPEYNTFAALAAASNYTIQ